MATSTRSIPFHRVEQTAGFWFNWFATNRDTTIDAVYSQFRNTGRLDALMLNWKESDPYELHIFYDSDIAKWIEAASYVLHYRSDNELEGRIEQIIDRIESGQDEHGYFNSYFLQVETDKRWQRRQDHELYCAGHLMEAAIAYADATGRERFLNLMTRYMDYIHDVFLVRESAAFKTPGHQEIELALIRLYRRNRNRKYLDLAAYFVDTRGRTDGTDAKSQERDTFGDNRRGYAQDHAPVARQTDARGHSVRFGYLFCAAADLAYERGDKELEAACNRVIRDVADRRMYVTGGVGNLAYGEAYGAPYVLPNKEAYTETCASISIAMLCRRLLELEPNGEWADLLELELYNGALAGISLSGDAFTYENPLEVLYRDVQFKQRTGVPTRPYERQQFFPCSCCPPNISRLLASIGEYQYAATDNAIYTHLYSASRALIDLASGTVEVRQATDYPWNGVIRFEIVPNGPVEFTLALRIPAWCRDWSIQVNREEERPAVNNGYACITRTWKPGDTVRLTLRLEAVEVEAHAFVAEDAGKVAVKVGPLVYCAEEADNGERLWAYEIPEVANYEIAWNKDLLGGINTVSVNARLRDTTTDNRLYREWNPRYSERKLLLIPYYAWCNREPGNMTVWLRKKS
jgi:DUF1680 family protein